MRCLYCGNRISLLRKIKDSEFCSDEHRDLFHQEQTALALARLTEAGNRMSQLRDQAEPQVTVAQNAVSEEPEQELRLPEPSGFLDEPPRRVAPLRPRIKGFSLDWACAIVKPRLAAPAGARLLWQIAPYFLPALPAARTDAQDRRQRGEASPADFKAVELRYPAAGLALDLSPEQALEAAEPRYPQAAACPIPVPPAMAPSRGVADPLAETGFQFPLARAASGSTLSALLPPWAAAIRLEPAAVGLRTGWQTPRVWPAKVRTSVRTLLNSPLQNIGADRILTETAWQRGLSAPRLAPLVECLLTPHRGRVRQTEPADAIVGALKRRMPGAAVLVEAAGLGLASARMPAPHATGPAAALVAEPAGPLQAAPALSLPSFGIRPRAAAAAASAVVVRVGAAAPQTHFSEIAGEIAWPPERRLPALNGKLGAPQWSQELPWAANEPPLQLPPLRGLAGTLRLAPLYSNAKSRRKQPVRAELPAAADWLNLSGLRVSGALAPAAAPLRGAVPGPGGGLEICAYIPTRRRAELRTRIAFPDSAKHLRRWRLELATSLKRLDENMKAVPDARSMTLGDARSINWESFPRPAGGSGRLMRQFPLYQLPAAMRAQTRLYPIHLGESSMIVPPVKPVGAAPAHMVCRPARLPLAPAIASSERLHERTSALLKTLLEQLETEPRHWAISRLWRHTPMVLKGVVVGVALFSALSAAGGGISAGHLGSLRAEISRRAAVALVDDFCAGMGAWSGARNWAETWSYDRAGFIQTGALALYRPSMRLSDYRFEFLGQIARKGMGWAFRARDTDNYYAMKIVFTGSGPMPKAVILRYAVIDGKPGPATKLPLPLDVRPDMMYRIRVDAEGPNFTAQFQDRIIDVWSDTQLAAGGVGLFSDKGEIAKVRWIEVSHHSDFLGKLCAYLAPFDAQGTGGSLRK